MNVMMARAYASGTPRTTKPIPISTASTKLTSACPDETAERRPDAVEDLRQVRPGRVAGNAAQPGHESWAVLEQKERDDDRGEQRHQRRRGAAPTPVNTPDAICALLELSLSLMAVTAELSCASTMFRGGPPSQSRHLHDARRRLLGQLGRLLDDRRRHGGDHADEHTDREQENEQDRRCRRHASAGQPTHRRPQHRADDQRQHHRKHDHPGLAHHPGEHPERGGNREERQRHHRTRSEMGRVDRAAAGSRRRCAPPNHYPPAAGSKYPDRRSSSHFLVCRPV